MKRFLHSILIVFTLLIFSSKSSAHEGNIMVGFFDGILHPVIGIDHLIAMISVGIISAQIGGLSIWLIPSLFVFGMLLGSIISLLIFYLRRISEPNNFISYFLENFADYIYFIVEFGIAFSVLFLGAVIFFNKKLPFVITSIIILSFGITHGAAHGLSIPYVIQPYLFILGFCIGTVILHLFGVLIGYYSNSYNSLNNALRLIGFLIIAFGIKLIINVL